MTVHLQRGAILSQQGRHADAIAEYQRHLIESPDDESIKSLLSLSYGAMEKYDEAIAYAHQAISENPECPKGYHALAANLAAQSKWRDSEQAIREALRIDPENVDYLSLLATALFGRRRFNAAMETCEQGLSIDPGKANLHRIADLIRIARGELNSGTGNSLSLEPDSDSSHMVEGLSKLYSANPKAALVHFREALRIDPNNDLARKGLMESLKRRNPLYNLLFNCLIRAARLHPLVQWMTLLTGLIVLESWLDIGASGNSFPIPIIAAMVCLAFAMCAVWLGAHLFNLLLLTNRLGRLSLKPNESRAALALGLSFLPPLGFLFAAMVMWDQSLLLCGIRGILLLVAAATFFRTWSKRLHLGWLAISICLLANFAFAIFQYAGQHEQVSSDVSEFLAPQRFASALKWCTYTSIILTALWPFLLGLRAAYVKALKEERAMAGK